VSLEETVATAVGRPVRALQPVPGGDINDAYRAELEGGAAAFVKTRPDAPPGEYSSEAAGLRWLAEPGGLGTPGVVGVHDPPAAADSSDGDGPRLLALTWLDDGLPGDEAALGRGLALVHAAGADSFGATPNGAPLRLGPLTLSNQPLPDWPSFYAERRLRPLLGPARDRGALSSGGAAAVERVCDRLAGDLGGPPEPPARLHGDLWGGNVLWSGGRPFLIDPAAYGGHREVDLAMLRLFGAPGPRMLAAYEGVAPLADGHEDRVGLWQLFPLLVHAVLFGGGYGSSVERTARRYMG
jgi:fructosamine-3-kinase